MIAPLLAWRHLVHGRARTLHAALAIGASVAALDLFAGHSATVRARLEMQAVVGERLGQLCIVRHDGGRFDMRETQALRQAAAGVKGVLLTLPQLPVRGMASRAGKTAWFRGMGMGIGQAEAAQANGLLPDLGAGVAVGKAHADQLGLEQGASIMLGTIARSGAQAPPVRADVGALFETADLGPDAPSVLMPLALAQSLAGKEQVERIAVYLSHPAWQEAGRTALRQALAPLGIPVDVLRWQDMSENYAPARRLSDVMLGCVAAVAASIVGATVGAAAAMNRLERRRELATLRALGLPAASAFAMFVLESLGVTAIGIAGGAAASGLAAWFINRSVLAYPQHAPPVMVELDPQRIGMAVLTLLALAALASALPAIKAARTQGSWA
ncbi:MAG: FtsX-like permease family protein [Pseudomonadota bacterium]